MSKLIGKDLFKLSKEEEALSKQIYGKVIKCLIAPYHNITNIPIEPNDTTYVYPERDLDIQQRKEIVSIMAASDKPEICFVTSDVFIIRDMINGCCRVLTPEGKVEAVQEKTFAANHHTVLHEILADERHIDQYKSTKIKSNNLINEVIKEIQSGKSVTAAQKKHLKEIIDNIGEPLISNKLSDMLEELKVKG